MPRITNTVFKTNFLSTMNWQEAARVREETQNQIIHTTSGKFLGKKKFEVHQMLDLGVNGTNLLESLNPQLTVGNNVMGSPSIITATKTTENHKGK